MKRVEIDVTDEEDAVAMTTVMYTYNPAQNRLDEEWARDWFLGGDPDMNGPRGIAIDDDDYVCVVGTATDENGAEDIASLIYEPNGCIRKDTAYNRGDPDENDVQVAADIALHTVNGHSEFIAVVGTTDENGTDDVLVIRYDWPAPWKWQEVTSMPYAQPPGRRKEIKAGGWLAYCPWQRPAIRGQREQDVGVLRLLVVRRRLAVAESHS
ncbi:MAG: hypothetical protein ABIK86_07700 [candidate division WOR-3 bacterium]